MPAQAFPTYEKLQKAEPLKCLALITRIARWITRSYLRHKQLTTYTYIIMVSKQIGKWKMQTKIFPRGGGEGVGGGYTIMA